MQQECKTLKTTIFGMAHSRRLVVVCFTSRHSTVFNPVNVIMNCGVHSGAVRADCGINQLRVQFQMVSIKYFTDKQAA